MPLPTLPLQKIIDYFNIFMGTLYHIQTAKIRLSSLRQVMF
jgi:hypothetical protein